MPVFTTAALIGTAIATGGSIAGGVIASRGAKGAANTQVEASDRASRQREG